MSRIGVKKIPAVHKASADCAKAQLEQLIKDDRPELLTSLSTRPMTTLQHVPETFKIQEDFKVRGKEGAAQQMGVPVEKVYLLDSRPIVYTRCSNPNDVPLLPPNARHLAITYISLGNSNSSNGLQTFAGTSYELESGEGLEVANSVDQSFSSNYGAFCIRFSWSRKKL